MRESTGGPAGLAACIFDLDGTLVDSEPLYFASEASFLAPWGILYDEALNEEMVGRGVEHFFRVLAERFPKSPFNALPLEERMRQKEADYLAYCEGRLKAFASMAALVPELRRRGLLLAVASGSSPAVIAHSLRTAGLESFFPVVLSASQVPRGKPAPDIFLEAARRLGVEPGACLVFEDARPGIEAARAAGMRCVAFPPAGHPARHPQAYAGLAACVEGGPDALSADGLLALLEGLGLPAARA